MRRQFIKQGILATGAVLILPHLATARTLGDVMAATPGRSSSPDTSESTDGDKISSLGFSYALVGRNFWNAKSYDGSAYFTHNSSPNSLIFDSTVTKATLKSPSAATIGYSSIYYGHFGPGNISSNKVGWLPMPISISDLVSTNLVTDVSYSVTNSGGLPFNLFYDLWAGSYELAISMYSCNRPAPGKDLGTMTLSDGSSWNVFKNPSDTKGHTLLAIRPKNTPGANGTSSINLSEMLGCKMLGLDSSSSLLGVGFGSEFLPKGSDLHWGSTSWTLSNSSNSLRII